MKAVVGELAGGDVTSYLSSAGIFGEQVEEDTAQPRLDRGNLATAVDQGDDVGTARPTRATIEEFDARRDRDHVQHESDAQMPPRRQPPLRRDEIR